MSTLQDALLRYTFDAASIISTTAITTRKAEGFDDRDSFSMF